MAPDVVALHQACIVRRAGACDLRRVAQRLDHALGGVKLCLALLDAGLQAIAPGLESLELTAHEHLFVRQPLRGQPTVRWQLRQVARVEGPQQCFQSQRRQPGVGQGFAGLGELCPGARPLQLDQQLTCFHRLPVAHQDATDHSSLGRLHHLGTRVDDGLARRHRHDVQLADACPQQCNTEQCNDDPHAPA